MAKGIIEEEIEKVKNRQIEISGLIRFIYDVAKNRMNDLNTSENADFVALTKVLNLPYDESIAPALKRAYIDASIMPPSWGGNIGVGLPEFVGGMRELGVNDEKISDYISETLEYRVVEGMGFGGVLECVAIPFVKSESVKSKIKNKLKKLQRESTSFRSNPKATYKSSWEKGKAKGIEELFRDHEQAIYELAKINEEIDSTFDYSSVIDWRGKAKVKKDRWEEEIKPELLSDRGDEGQFKKLFIKQQQLLNEVPYHSARDRAIQLAWLDIILDSKYAGGAGGKGAAYASALYNTMVKFAEALECSPDFIEQIKKAAKERYGADL